MLKFLFYFLYLIAAELPLFFILWIRNGENEKVEEFLILLLNTAIILNIIIFGVLLFKIILTKDSVKFTKIKFESENKVKQALSDFFAFFLLPFFTFNLTSSNDVFTITLEMLTLFLLLTIFIFRTNNLSSNIFVFMLFNIYEISVTGKNITLLTPYTRADIESNLNPIYLQAIGNYYLYFETKKEILKKLLVIIFILFLILLFSLFGEELLERFF